MEWNSEEHINKFYNYAEGFYISKSSDIKVCERCMDTFPEHIGIPMVVDGIGNGIKIKKLPDFCKTEECDNFNPKNKGKKKKERYYFGCIAPRVQRVPYTVEGINRIIDWCEAWFNHLKYSKYFWWIETGKDIDNPKLHIHYIWKCGKLLDTKNHARNIRTEWNTFNGIGKITEKDEYYSNAFTDDVLCDKLGYAINSSKDLHENFRDLLTNPPEGARGCYGGCNSLTAKFRELRVNIDSKEIEK